MTGRLGIDDVTPKVGDGHHPSKAVVGEVIPIGASIWREGHDAIAANVELQTTLRQAILASGPVRPGRRTDGDA